MDTKSELGGKSESLRSKKIKIRKEPTVVQALMLPLYKPPAPQEYRQNPY